MAIGIGTKTYNAKRITESNGTAFVHSGRLEEELKKLKVNLAIRTDFIRFDEEMNLYLKLASLTMDRWTPTAAKMIHVAMKNVDKSQEALGKMLDIRQNTVSTRLKRACYYDIRELLAMYRTKVAELR